MGSLICAEEEDEEGEGKGKGKGKKGDGGVMVLVHPWKKKPFRGSSTAELTYPISP